MKFDFPSKIRSGYLIAFLLLLFSYFLSISALVQLREQNRWVDHSREVINKLELLISYIKDAEISWRNYIMVGDEKFLEPYFLSRQAVDSVCQNLSVSVKDNPVEKERVDLLRQMVNRKYLSNDQQLEAFKGKPFQVSEPFRARTISSKKLMDSIGVISKEIGLYESGLLNLRIRRVGFSQKIVFGIIVAAGIISGLLILYSLITFNMESRAKRNATEQAATYHDQLEKRVKELDSANRELIELRSLERFTSTGQIARVIAHEVRNPLTNIDLSAGHLENINLLPEDRKMFLDIITRNSKRINQLINELLTATKFSELKYEKIRVDELLEESLLEARDRLQLNRVVIERKYSPKAIWLNVDRNQMKIALLNIIVNAIEAMPHENGILSISTAIIDGNCQIKIGDNGKGMTAEILSKIFDPYFTSKSKGNGLGLTNTQNIILNHKGRIQVLSEAGKGTEFIIVLNRLAAD
ncbi:MAG: CHASE3 domain-containing protein [Chitinophagales bacterium]